MSDLQFQETNPEAAIYDKPVEALRRSDLFKICIQAGLVKASEPTPTKDAMVLALSGGLQLAKVEVDKTRTLDEDVEANELGIDPGILKKLKAKEAKTKAKPKVEPKVEPEAEPEAEPEGEDELFGDPEPSANVQEVIDVIKKDKKTKVADLRSMVAQDFPQLAESLEGATKAQIVEALETLLD